jgi:uncharacterized linocin/CFP29 family protein
MLRFTEQQQLAVNSARAHFNTTEVARAASLPPGDLALVGNAAQVPIDAWRRLDTRAVQIQRDVLAVFNRLAMANTTPLSVADLVSYFPQISDSGDVSVSMDGRHTGKADQAVIKYTGTPVPAVSSEARFGWRQMEVIRKGGGMIDAETVANHQRKVAEKAEDLVLNGDTSVVVGGSTIYGLRNHPQRNTDTHGFDLSAATGANWLATFQKLINALVGDNAFGRVTVFLNYADWVYASINEFTSGYPKTILQRLREIEQIAEIIPAGRVPADNVLGVAGLDNGNWGSILSAMPMATVPKVRHNAQDDYVFQVLMMAAPQLRTDFDGRAPFAHLTAS